MAIFRRYAAIFRVGISFIFSSIKARSSSVTRNLICTVLFLPLMRCCSFPFLEGLGHFPTSIFADKPQGEGKNTERVPLSYACYETFSLTSYNTGNTYFDRLMQKKNAAILIKDCNVFSIPM